MEILKFRIVIHCNEHYVLHKRVYDWMRKWLHCDIPIKRYEVLNTAMYGIIQNNFQEMWVFKVCNLCLHLYWPIKIVNVPQHLFPSISSLKKEWLVWLCLLWWIFTKNTSKITHFELKSFFLLLPYNSKSILPQRPSFGHAGTHIVTLATHWNKVLNFKNNVNKTLNSIQLWD